MALDIKALLAKKKQMDAATGNNSIFKPQPGDNVIRLVPLASNPENPFQELQFTYPGGKTTLSPESFGKPDPIANFGRALRAEGRLGKDEWAATKPFVPAARMYVPIVVRGQEKDGVKFWAISKTTFNTLVEIMSDDDYGDITDPKSGHDLKLTYTPKDKSSTGFPETSIMTKPKKTPLTDDAALTQKLLTEQPNLLDQFPLLTYEELERLLSATINKTEPTTAASATDGWATPAATAPSASVAKSEESVAKATTMNKDSLNDFAKLFEE